MSTDQRLEPLPAPKPNRPFAGRDWELNLIANKLHSYLLGHESKMSLVVTCFWGAFGVGKSWLLNELENLYKRTPPEKGKFKRPTISARLNLDPLRTPDLWLNEKLNRARLVEELWQQFAEQVPEISWEPPDDHENAETWVSTLISHLTIRLQGRFTPVILLDTLEMVVKREEEAFFWLEERLIEPLALTDQVLFILSSRGELRRWRRFQVRRRVDNHQLTAFDDENVADSIMTNIEVSRLLSSYTFGHPLATEYLARLLQEEGHLNLAAATEDKEKQVRDVRMAIDTSGLYTRVLEEVVQRALELAPADLQEWTSCLGVLRQVNVEPLRRLAEKIGLAQSEADIFYLDHIGRLQAAHLLYWDIESSSYQMDNALRRLLSNYLKLNQPTRFWQAHLAAYDYYREQLKKYPAYVARYTPEIFYHGAILANYDDLPKDVPRLSTWWQESHVLLDLDSAVDWRELSDTLRKDGELVEILTNAGLEELLNSIEVREATITS